MGDFVARVIRDDLSKNRGASPPSSSDEDGRSSFTYRDKGNLATIGKAKAVADISGRFIGGFLAWVIWCVIHVMFLVSFRNKLFVMMGWAYNYLIHSSGARLITGSARPDVTRAFSDEGGRKSERPTSSSNAAQ
jgi:NADH dehydrogenase FAD-containing subunit